MLLITVEGDYSDAISRSTAIAQLPHLTAEGGAKNCARRDGMATVMLDAATTIGRIPDYYVQAVGSGTGAIAAWEVAQRLIRTDGIGQPPAPHDPVAESPVCTDGACMEGREAGDQCND